MSTALHYTIIVCCNRTAHTQHCLPASAFHQLYLYSCQRHGSFTPMHVIIFGQRLSYIRDFLVSISDLPGRARLRSAAPGLYEVRFMRTQFGRQAFSVAAMSEWNSIAVELRLMAELKRFKRSLKSHLFSSKQMVRHVLIDIYCGF